MTVPHPGRHRKTTHGRHRLAPTPGRWRRALTAITTGSASRGEA